MGPFLDISRHDRVDLPSPWDPARVIEEYIEQTEGAPSALIAAVDIQALQKGTRIRYQLQHRWMGTIEAEMRIVVLSPVQITVEVDAAIWLRWWLRPLAIPFRPRVRRFVHRQINAMLDELQDEPAPIVEPASMEPTIDAPNEGARAEGRTSWILQVLTPEGRTVYQHSEGSLHAHESSRRPVPPKF